MAGGLGIAVLFMGYSLAFYGLTQVQGGNWGFLDLIWPGRWSQTSVQNIPRDGSHK